MPGLRGRSAMSSSAASTPGRCARGGAWSMRSLELVAEVLGGEEAWLVGGAVRDELLGRPVLDLDVSCREPEPAARALRALAGDAVFPLNERFGAWRVVLDGGTTVDFSPLKGESIEDDLAERDFTSNAVAWPVAGGEYV